jgi:hypothetical protein
MQVAVAKVAQKQLPNGKRHSSKKNSESTNNAQQQFRYVLPSLGLAVANALQAQPRYTKRQHTSETSELTSNASCLRRFRDFDE